MKKLEISQMENLQGGISGCGWMGIAGGVLGIALLASPAGWVYVGGVAAAGLYREIPKIKIGRAHV